MITTLMIFNRWGVFMPLIKQPKTVRDALDNFRQLDPTFDLKDCKDEDDCKKAVKKFYKKMALLYHPDKAKTVIFTPQQQQRFDELKVQVEKNRTPSLEYNQMVERLEENFKILNTSNEVIARETGILTAWKSLSKSQPAATEPSAAQPAQTQQQPASASAAPAKKEPTANINITDLIKNAIYARWLNTLHQQLTSFKDMLAKLLPITSEFSVTELTEGYTLSLYGDSAEKGRVMAALSDIKNTYLADKAGDSYIIKVPPGTKFGTPDAVTMWVKQYCKTPNTSGFFCIKDPSVEGGYLLHLTREFCNSIAVITSASHPASIANDIACHILPATNTYPVITPPLCTTIILSDAMKNSIFEWVASAGYVIPSNLAGEATLSWMLSTILSRHPADIQFATHKTFCGYTLTVPQKIAGSIETFLETIGTYYAEKIHNTAPQNKFTVTLSHNKMMELLNITQDDIQKNKYTPLELSSLIASALKNTLDHKNTGGILVEPTTTHGTASYQINVRVSDAEKQTLGKLFPQATPIDMTWNAQKTQFVSTWQTEIATKYPGAESPAKAIKTACSSSSNNSVYNNVLIDYLTLSDPGLRISATTKPTGVLAELIKNCGGLNDDGSVNQEFAMAIRVSHLPVKIQNLPTGVMLSVDVDNVPAFNAFSGSVFLGNDGKTYVTDTGGMSWLPAQTAQPTNELQKFIMTHAGAIISMHQEANARAQSMAAEAPPPSYEEVTRQSAGTTGFFAHKPRERQPHNNELLTLITPIGLGSIPEYDAKTRQPTGRHFPENYAIAVQVLQQDAIKLIGTASGTPAGRSPERWVILYKGNPDPYLGVYSPDAPQNIKTIWPNQLDGRPENGGQVALELYNKRDEIISQAKLDLCVNVKLPEGHQASRGPEF